MAIPSPTMLHFNCLLFMPKISNRMVFEMVSTQGQNTQVNILAWQKSKTRSRVWIVQNNLHIAET